MITDEKSPEGIIEIRDPETLSIAWVDSNIKICESVILFNSTVIIVSPLSLRRFPERCLVWKYCHSKADTVSLPMSDRSELGIGKDSANPWDG